MEYANFYVRDHVEQYENDDGHIATACSTSSEDIESMYKNLEAEGWGRRSLELRIEGGTK